MEKSTMFKEKKLLRKLWECLNRRRRLQFFLLLALMVLAAILEVVSLGAVLPFLGVITNPEQVYQFLQAQSFINFTEIKSAHSLVFPITMLFIFVVIFSGLVRLFLLYAITKFSFSTGADLSFDIYRRTLYQNFSVHISRNSSEIINSIAIKTNTVVNGVINPILSFISSLVILIAIMGTLLFIDTKIALIALFGFGFFYIVITIFTRKRLKINSDLISKESTQVIKLLQEGLGGIRDVLIDGNQKFYYNLYRGSDLPLRRALGENQYISASPRYAMEAVGMALIAIIAYTMTQGDRSESVIPILGALALGAQRLLPALQQVYSSYSTVKGSISSLRDVIFLLKQPLPKNIENQALNPIEFRREISLKNVGFRYSSNAPLSLSGVNLTIAKGSCVGFIGVTGSGKSTLLDIIMGLLSPTIGKLTIDGEMVTDENRRVWQSNIAHVPQNIYLSDSTIEENIAFGIPKEEINHQRVKEVAKQAHIAELVEGWKDGYQTFVGEQGIRLSGGQRQRIGIARALYKKAKVLIFDEATSALDGQTEKKIMNIINKLDNDLTILIIAHRVTTLKECDQIIDISELGNIVVKKYDDIFSDT